MGQFQVPPIKQMPTQFKRMQRQLTQAQHAIANKNNNISWTLAAYVNGWLPTATGQDLFYEVTPDGNFVYMSAKLLVPSGVSSPGVVATLDPSVTPVRVQFVPALTVSGTGNPSSVIITIDTSANVSAQGPLTAGNTLWISGMYPLYAQPAM